MVSLFKKYIQFIKTRILTHAIDFDAQFYMPAKHFMSEDIDTFYFNTAVIWSMTLVLAIALYFDILRKIIDGIGNLSSPYKRK